MKFLTDGLGHTFRCLMIQMLTTTEPRTDGHDSSLFVPTRRPTLRPEGRLDGYRRVESVRILSRLLRGYSWDSDVLLTTLQDGPTNTV